MSATPEVRWFRLHSEGPAFPWSDLDAQGLVDLALTGWIEVTVSPVVAQDTTTPADGPDSDVIEQAARAMADDWDPDRDPFLLAMFRDYANTLAAAGLLARSHATPPFTTEQEIESLASEIHEAYAYQYDECDHGTYTGGAMHGEPYSMCRINAERIIRRRSNPPVAATCGYRFPLPSWAGEVQMDRCVCVLATNHDGAHTCSHATPPVAATGEGYCVCNGPDRGGRMPDCGISAHRAEAVAATGEGE